MKNFELLAPAGSFDVMKACIAAGADAVYMGLSKFSARAYADNASDVQYADAIDYAHLHGKKLYLTVNTLFKEDELPEVLDTLRPLYKAGLDAVIVQDLGAMQRIHEAFPLLPIHVSTQATVTGPGAVPFLKMLGAKRIVPARELSLSEVKALINADIDVECFIHGALCYCYSGQCLFSSLVGGRSGNRGRCAQPCRMPYQAYDEKGQRISKRNENYLLSLKDLNTLRLLPKLMDAGIRSFKIEGRMKKAEYAAGVTSIYRKYMDMYLNGPAAYYVDPEDEKHLFDLFNRQGFTDGYYLRHNGAKMLTKLEPDFREQDNAYIESIREHFIREHHRLPVSMNYSLFLAEPASVTVKAHVDNQDFELTYTDPGFIPESASGHAATKEEVKKQLSKTGDTGFFADRIEGGLDEGLFLPVSKINAFRRAALEAFEDTICSAYRRTE